MDSDEDATSIYDVYLQFYENKTFTDVDLLVKSENDCTTISAHRLILSIWSPVFADMISEVAEVWDVCFDTCMELEITDMSPEVMKAMVEFMYGSIRLLLSQRLKVNFIMETYRAATRFNVVALKNICSEMLESIIPNERNVFQVLEARELTGGSSSNKYHCYEVLQAQTEEVLATHELCNVTLAMMQTILNLPNVSFSSEFELSKWVFAWVKNQFVKESNYKSFREILDDVLPFLNFTALKPGEFGKLMELYRHVITEQEGFGIFMNIVNPGSWTFPWLSKFVERSYSYEGF